ncbi:SDR family oxidoreductase [Membranicola marinus]|uniref:SDR family oxidoreductase n=1 Tax=Membranihabitans marinus TaxID=1227546 RepID=A0A953HYS7_9BACT|nr:SDR family NAD(P)-dependent oxidoreductase [Membranihabitans marinus]MBY5960258.1 SDR family oxidoreductase [Membranihabitans marinus]
MNPRNHAQVAVITGAATGLGAAIARHLAQKQVKLALLDIDEKGLQKIKKELPEDCAIHTVDVTDENQVRKTVQKVESHFGSIDILINSAGITGQTNIQSHQVQEEDLQRVFDINFKGSWLMSKYILPGMIQRDYGRILHIASIAGKEGNAGMLAYSASKAAVIGMTKVQGKEYAETGITVNALAPAVIRTDMVAKLPQEQVTYMTDKIPMKRCGTLDELANMAGFIVSPENSFATGFCFDLSGGRATY